MALPDLQSSDLTKEKSLWALYKLTYKFPWNRFNVVVTILCAIFISVFVSLSKNNIDHLSSTARALFGFGNAIAPAILGFLIAGFTIFVTVTKVEIFVMMAKRPYGESGESYLKYNLSAFLLAFVHYLSYLFFCVVVVLFGQPQSAAIQLVKSLTNGYTIFNMPAYNLTVLMILIFFGTWTAYLVLLLKSFVYNTYQVITTTVRWELEGLGKPVQNK